MIYAYPCQLAPDEDGALVAVFPDVPEAVTGGGDRDEALAMAEDALAVALAGYVREGWDIPLPSRTHGSQVLVPVPTGVAAKIALYTAMREQHVTEADLAGRLGVDEAAAHRLADPDHRSHMEQVTAALRALGRSLAVEISAV